MSEEIVAMLREPFGAESIDRRPDGFSYIDQFDIVTRLLDATGGVFDLAVQRGPELVSDGTKSFWLCVVTITIEGVGTRTGVGTHFPQNPKGAEDSPKAAFTDALKRAAVLFGTGLQLYEKESHPAPQQRREQGAATGERAVQTTLPINDTDHACPVCHAPAGKPHAHSCPSLRQGVTSQDARRTREAMAR